MAEPSMTPDPRLDAVFEMLVELAHGKTDVRIDVSDAGDNIDAIMMGLNMFAEELARSRRDIDELRAGQLSQFFDLSLDLLCILDADGVFRRVNPAWSRTIGMAHAELVERSIFELVHPDDRATVKNALARLARGQQAKFECRFIDALGETRWLTWSASSPEDPVYAVVRDVTAQKLAAEESAQAARQLEAQLADLARQAANLHLLNEMGDLMQSCSSQDDALKVLRHFVVRMFPGESGAVYLTSASLDCLDAELIWGDRPPDPSIATEDCWALRRGRGHSVSTAGPGLACHHIHASDDEGYACIPLVAQGDTLGVLSIRFENDDQRSVASREQYVVAVADQISLALSNLRLRSRLQEQSNRDGLTGLNNRRHLELAGRRALSRTLNAGQSASIMMLDLDDFKRFNDDHGHAAGDAVLIKFAHVLQEGFRDDDVVCRFGGEEFVVMLLGASPSVALRRAEALRKTVEELTIRHSGTILPRATVSIGVAHATDERMELNALLESADQALYRAKNGGRNRVVNADDEDATGLRAAG